MSVQSAVLAGRRAAEARMTSTCTIYRANSAGSQDELTGVKKPGWDVVYTGPCRVSGASKGAGTAERITGGGVEYQLAARTLHLPASASDIAASDLADITTGDCAGMVLRVLEGDRQDQSTARRMPVVAERRPVEWS